MLAYVFWHRPAPGTDAALYERALAEFHEALAAAPPSGFHRSWAFRLASIPWLGDATGYEDWYLVDDFAALGALNEAAVSASLKAPHDAVAGLAAEGAGGVYRIVAGAPRPETVAIAAWLAKPAGKPDAEFLAELGGTVWQRQMTLGPTPEFCLHLPAAAQAPAEAVKLEVTRL